MELPERVRMLRNVAIKIASPVIKVTKDKQIANLTEKKQMALECQALGINQVNSFSKEMKEVWINNCYNGLRMMYDFTELRSSYGKEISFPFQNYPEITNPSPLNALEFQVNFELNISLGFLSRTNCGRRTLMFVW